ncbi:MAG: hotdog fold thioesterase [bacterium]|nr:MAG: hotdog fold thioesterase [bacterium]
MIWAKKLTLEQMNDMMKNSIEEQLGIEMVELGNDFIKAKMPVDRRTRQPFGVLHGGASVVLAESLGSFASYLTLKSEDRIAVGIEINANHIRSVTQGEVTGIAHPIHLGKQTHVWEIKILNEKNKLVCISRLTVAILPKKIDQ